MYIGRRKAFVVHNGTIILIAENELIFDSCENHAVRPSKDGFLFYDYFHLYH